jgi:hypothetical protein
MAQQVIDAQTKEIAAMIDWLKKAVEIDNARKGRFQLAFRLCESNYRHRTVPG